MGSYLSRAAGPHSRRRAQPVPPAAQDGWHLVQPGHIRSPLRRVVVRGRVRRGQDGQRSRPQHVDGGRGQAHRRRSAHVWLQVASDRLDAPRPFRLVGAQPLDTHPRGVGCRDRAAAAAAAKGQEDPSAARQGQAPRRRGRRGRRERLHSYDGAQRVWWRVPDGSAPELLPDRLRLRLGRRVAGWQLRAGGERVTDAVRHAARLAARIGLVAEAADAAARLPACGALAPPGRRPPAAGGALRKRRRDFTWRGRGRGRRGGGHDARAVAAHARASALLCRRGGPLGRLSRRTELRRGASRRARPTRPTWPRRRRAMRVADGAAAPAGSAGRRRGRARTAVGRADRRGLPRGPRRRRCADERPSCLVERAHLRAWLLLSEQQHRRDGRGGARHARRARCRRRGDAVHRAHRGDASGRGVALVGSAAAARPAGAAPRV